MNIQIKNNALKKLSLIKPGSLVYHDSFTYLKTVSTRILSSGPLDVHETLLVEADTGGIKWLDSNRNVREVNQLSPLEVEIPL